MDVGVHLKQVSNLFRSRFLSDAVKEQGGYDVVTFVHDYIEHNEVPLAFDILCHQLFEYNILISEGEYELLDVLRRNLYPQDYDQYDFLQKLRDYK